MKTLYIVLENGKIVRNKDVNPQFNDILEEYEEDDDPSMKLIAEEVIGIWDNKKSANEWKEQLELIYPDNKYSIGELHLIDSVTDWN